MTTTRLVWCPSCSRSESLRPLGGMTYEALFYAVKKAHESRGCSWHRAEAWRFSRDWDAPREPQWLRGDRSRLVLDKKEGVHRLIPLG